ncbi:MAG: hypothetical protein PHU23_01110 [Dehalococcoidales bacterium]|nr:hypothetical protein [Dehalococcoidales bacterium]
MAENNKPKDSKAIELVGATAAITGAIVLLTRKAEAAGLTLPPEVIQLMAAIAQSSYNTELSTAEIRDLIKTLELTGGINGPPEYPNNRTMTAFVVVGNVAGRPYQVPGCDIPEGRQLVIKGYPTNGGLTYVGFSSPSSANWQQSWPLRGNESIAYKIKNSNELWVSFQVAGERAVFTVEQD